MTRQPPPWLRASQWSALAIAALFAAAPALASGDDVRQTVHDALALDLPVAHAETHLPDVREPEHGGQGEHRGGDGQHDQKDDGQQGEHGGRGEHEHHDERGDVGEHGEIGEPGSGHGTMEEERGSEGGREGGGGGAPGGGPGEDDGEHPR